MTMLRTIQVSILSTGKHEYQIIVKYSYKINRK